MPVNIYRKDITRDEALLKYWGEEAWIEEDNPIVDQFGDYEFLVTFPVYNDEIIEGEIVGWIRETYMNNQLFNMMIEC